MIFRKDNATQITRKYLGESFSQDVVGGQRKFTIRMWHNAGFQSPRLINAWLQTFGIFLFVCGIVGFVIERRLFKL